MRFVSRPELDDAVKEVLAGRDVRCAVAFWGRGAEALFGNLPGRAPSARIVCNLRAGGTNPRVIRALIKAGAKVLQRDDLHANVYISNRGAVVASANASANGLGLEGREVGGWIEAGTVLSDPSIPSHWFEELWKQSRVISSGDLKAAQAAWDARQRVKPTIASFAEFEVGASTLPLVGWYEYGSWKTNVEAFRKALGRYDPSVESLISDGVDVPPGEEKCIRRGRWVLKWRRLASGRAGGRPGLYWAWLSGTIIPKAVRYHLGGRRLGGSMAVALASRP